MLIIATIFSIKYLYFNLYSYLIFIINHIYFPIVLQSNPKFNDSLNNPIKNLYIKYPYNIQNLYELL